MRIGSIPFHAFSMSTGEHRTFATVKDLTGSEVLNNCDQVIAVRDNKTGQLLEVDFTPSGRSIYLTGNTVAATQQGLQFNVLV